MSDDVRVVATGSAHDPEGRLRKNSPGVIEVLERLQAKVAAHADEMALVSGEPCEGAETLVVSYGISARAAREACRRLRAAGRRVSFLQLQTLFPVPLAALRRAARDCSRVFVVEENLTGLYASVLESHLSGARVARVNALGRMIAPAEIVAAVEAPS